ncbi:MAG: hypothetical protein AAF851_05765 [Myxococcota bacterium]
MNRELVRLLRGRTGAVLHEGPSLLDGAPIVVIATALKPRGKNANSKTGDAVQTWILRRDMLPIDAVRSGDDASICGDCFHRAGPGRLRSCYPDIRMPSKVWHAYTRNTYLRVHPSELEPILAVRPFRAGSYGDPAAAPPELWAWAKQHAPLFWGYTHQWHLKVAEPLRALGLMASVESEHEAEHAQALGWRTFRVRPEATKWGAAHDRPCPADTLWAKATNRKRTTTCVQCQACAPGGTRNITVTAHGGARRQLVNRLVAHKRLPVLAA